MLTRKSSPAAAASTADASARPEATAATDPHTAPTPRNLDDVIAYFEGDFVPMRDA
jgi:hypothetical protein